MLILQFHANGFITRNHNDYLEHLKLIEFDTSCNCIYSTTYGINGRSLLMRFYGFDVRGSSLLSLDKPVATTKGYFMLEQLIQSHQYGYLCGTKQHRWKIHEQHLLFLLTVK